MGQTGGIRRISDAAGRRADRGLAARPALTGLLGRFARDERGATAIEYGLIAAGIVLAIITVLTTLGGKTQAMYDAVAAAIGAAIGS